MVCVICSKPAKDNDSNDCFEAALNTLRQHYNFYKNSVKKRDLETLQLKERNDELIKALGLLQKSQQPAKRFKTSPHGSWLSPIKSDNLNTSKDDPVTETSLTDDDDVAAGASNLNMALNSEQLFDTSTLSPAPKLSNSELVISPRIGNSPLLNKQSNGVRGSSSNHISRSKSEFAFKENPSAPDKTNSWATKFVKPAAKAKPAEHKKTTEIKKPERKLNLSLKKVNPSKIKQSLLNFNNSRDSSAVESDICDDVIDASPVVNKSSRAGRSWAQRSGLSYSNILENTNPAGEETKLSHEVTTSVPIEHIVFDFSPTKKSDQPITTDSPATKLSSTQLNFDKMANETNFDGTVMPADHSTQLSSQSSSVVMLTPATQDVIFVDDTCNEIGEVDTLDLLADIMKDDNTETLKNLKRYESKNMEKQQKLTYTKQKYEKENKLDCNKPLVAIKKEKNSQLLENSHACEETKTKSLTSSNRKPEHVNPLFNDEDQEEDDDDEMPRPMLIKKEPEHAKKLTILQRLNINCDDCEKYVNFFGDRLPDSELIKHISQCRRHRQPYDLGHNTPEGFWDPFIASFAENDPRNEVLIDTRFKDKKRMDKF